MAENLTLEEIQAQKEALLNAARGNIKNSTNVYQDYLNNAVNQENQGALYSYRNSPTASETDRLQSRSAYLNRRAQNEEAISSPPQTSGAVLSKIISPKLSLTLCVLKSERR